MSIIPQKLNMVEESVQWNTSRPTANKTNLVNIEDMKSELGLQELFAFAPSTKKIMINERSSIRLKSTTTITSKPQK